MKRIRIAIGADHYQKLYQNIMSIANEAISRKHEVFWFDFNKVTLHNGKVYIPLRRISKKIHLTQNRMLSNAPIEKVEAKLLDCIIIKKDPPVSHKSLNILKNICNLLLVVNDPHGIIKYESKTYLKKLTKLTVPTYFSSSVAELERAVRRLGNCVLKKEIGYGGANVYHVFIEKGEYYMQSKKVVEPKKIDIKKLLKKLTKNGSQEILVVKYLKRVGKGDKRILIFDNHIMGAYLRMPKNKKGWICNVSSGGYIKRTRLTKNEIKIVHSVEKMLKKDKIYTIGIDTLEDDNGKRVLSEVNTTNVGGIYSIEKLYHRNVSKHIIDWIEKRV